MPFLELIILFCFGYAAIIFEDILKINKSAVALILGGTMWIVSFLNFPHGYSVDVMMNLSDIAQVIFFLLAAMTIVELIDSHDGFSLVSRLSSIKSKIVLLWFTILASFFMSSVLDNLTAIIILASLLKKMLSSQKERWFIGSIGVIAVNAGGAWTPLGDVTTTMLWINNKITTLGIMKALFLPSLACVIVPGLIVTFIFSKSKDKKIKNPSTPLHTIMKTQPGAFLILFLGLGSLIMVPIWKSLLGIPPFLGGLLGLGIVWLVSDRIHSPHGESRKHLRVPHVFTKIDISSITFFIGILLAVNALSFSGVLISLSNFLNNILSSKGSIAIVLGLCSSILDNVPLVAAVMNMYSFSIDDVLWQLIAYTAGTGGSVFIIGSASGVALMGIEKVSFLWYLRKVSWLALIGYFAGIIVYFGLK